jgi:hypothetical protein
MNCTEFREFLPDVVEGVRNPDHEYHLKGCLDCLNLVSELEIILRDARQLEGMFEPGPQVWDNIETTLRQEGLIRQPQWGPELVSPPRRQWKPVWLMAPVAAAILIALAVVYERPVHTEVATAKLPAVAGPAEPAPKATSDDQELLNAVSLRTPAVRAAYQANLRYVDAYIRDAEASARQDPNDEEAQRSLMNAYEQRSMVYEMAMDRSMP